MKKVINLLKSEEALAFQGNSKLGDGLTKVFQKAIDFKNEAFRTNPNLNRKKKTEIIKAYCEKNLRQELNKVIYECTNFYLQDLNLETPNIPIFLYSVYVYDLTGDDKESMGSYILGSMANGDISTEELEEALDYDYIEKETQSAIKDLINISKSFNEDTGKFGSNTVNNKKVGIKITIDIVAFFLFSEYVEDTFIEPLTARELASTLLHEIGHVVTLVERFKDMTNTITRVVNSGLLIENNINNNTKLDTTEKTKSLIESKFKIAKLNNKIVKSKEVDEILSMIDKVMIFNQDKLDTKLGAVISRTVLSILTIILSILSYPLVTIFTCLLINSNSKYIDSYIKKGDVVSTPHLLYMMERDADEFVVRSGYGGDSSSFDNKCHQYFDNINSSIVDKKLEKVSCLSYLFSQIGKGMRYKPTLTYEDDLDRVYRLLQANIGAFKNIKDIPFSMLSHYLSQHEKIMMNLKEMQKRNRVSEEVKSIKLFLAKIPNGIASTFGTTLLVSDYEKFQNQLEDIINNQLYYQQAKFKQLYNEV